LGQRKKEPKKERKRQEDGFRGLEKRGMQYSMELSKHLPFPNMYIDYNVFGNELGCVNDATVHTPAHTQPRTHPSKKCYHNHRSRNDSVAYAVRRQRLANTQTAPRCTYKSAK